MVEFITRSLPGDARIAARSADRRWRAGARTRRDGSERRTPRWWRSSGRALPTRSTGPIAATIEMSSGSSVLMSAQLGLGGAPLFDDRTPLRLQASFEGTPTNSYEVSPAARRWCGPSGLQRQCRAGRFQGHQRQRCDRRALADPSALMEMAGAEGVYVPPLTGTARLQFEGRTACASARSMPMVRQDARADPTRRHRGCQRRVEHRFTELGALLPCWRGRRSMIAGSGVWPEGRSTSARTARQHGPHRCPGRRDAHGRAAARSTARFGLAWDDQSISLRELTGRVGEGTLTLDATVCCANAPCRRSRSGAGWPSTAFRSMPWCRRRWRRARRQARCLGGVRRDG